MSHQSHLRAIQTSTSASTSQPIARSPIPHPPLVNITTLLIEPQIGTQPNLTLQILIARTPMNRIRIMKDDIPSFKIRHQPLPMSLCFIHMKAPRIIRQLAVFTHIDIERADSFLLRERRRTSSEVILDAATQSCWVGEIDQAAAIQGDIPNGDPCRQEICTPVAQEQFVVVDAGAKSIGDIVTDHRALEKDLLVPVHQFTYHLPQGRMFKKVEVVGEDVGRDHFLDVPLPGREEPRANAGVIAGVFGGIEDAIFRRCAGL